MAELATGYNQQSNKKAGNRNCAAPNRPSLPPNAPVKRDDDGAEPRAEQSASCWNKKRRVRQPGLRLRQQQRHVTEVCEMNSSWNSDKKEL